MTDDRIPLATRLLRPRYTREVTFLAGELRRSGLEPQTPDTRVAVELGYEAGRRRAVDRPIVRRAPRIRRSTATGRRHVGRARALLDELAALDDRQVLVEGRAMRVGRLRARMTGLGEVLDIDRRTRLLDRSSRLLRAVGIGLLLIDTIALVIVFAFLLNLDWLRPEPANLVTAVALALFGAGVQAVVAVHLGRRLWSWRHADPDEREFPPRSAVVLVGGGALAVVSTFAAGAIFMRIQREGVLADAGSTATALGLLLAASALVAPWCLVADEAYAAGPDVRELRTGSRLLVRDDRRRERIRRRVRRLLRRADNRLARAEHLMAVALHRVGAAQGAVHATVLDGRALAWPSAVYRADDVAAAHAAARAAWPDRPGCRDGARAVLPMTVPVDDRTLVLPVCRLRDELTAARTDYALVQSDLDLAS